METTLVDAFLPALDQSMLFGGGLAALVFGFLAFQDRVVSLLMGRRDSPVEELLDES